MDIFIIFFWILNTSISASFFVLAIILLRLVLKKAPKALFVVLWGLVALRLICPFDVESSLSLVPSAETIPTEQFYFDQYEALHDDYELDIVDNPNYPDSVQYTLPGNVGSNSAKFVFNYFHWLCGMAAMLIYTVISYIIVKRKVRISAPLKDNIYLCDNISTPFILGIIKPKIYIPSNINEQDMEYVVAHEKAHLKRRDHWWKPLGFLLLTVYWFNPVLWVAYILLCKDIELACDEKVIKDMGTAIKKPYSNALINCSVPRKTISACPLAFGETGVKSRIKSVLNYKKPAFWVIMVAIIASIVLAVCFLTNPRDNSDIFNAKYETGKCLFSFVITEEKATRTNNHVFGINSTGGVYKDYGNGVGEYIGELKESDFSAAEMNRLLRAQDAKTIYLGRTKESYEILNDEGEREYVFIQKKNGDVVAIFFFSDGRIMNIFNLDKISSADEETKDDELDNELGQFIDLCIAEHNQSEDEIVEFMCVERKVLGTRKFFNKTTVYMWVMFEEYSNNDGIILEHGAYIPTVITVEKESEGFWIKGNGGYKLVEYWEPRDGSDYADDIRRKFPWYLESSVFDSQEYVDEMSENIERKVMEYYGVEYAAFGSIDAYNEKTFGKNLTLSDVVILSYKGSDLSWADFEDFNYIETGSGLYIRQYNIDEMFTLQIGGSGPDSEPMYFYLHASDAWDEQIDIREADVEDFIREHEKNPVVKKLSAGWYTAPVGYNDKTLSRMFEISGVPKYSNLSSVMALPAVKIEDKTELQSFVKNMSGVMSFDSSYSDTPSLNSIIKEYDDEFFYGSSLLLVYTTAPTTAHRHTVEYISKSEGVLSIGISEIDPEAGDTAMEGWLIAINVSKTDTADITEISAQISSTQFPNRGTSNAQAVRVYVFNESDEIVKPTITLFDNGMFQFNFSAFSSYIGIGEYILENNRLTLNTNDEKFTYTFDVVNDNLVFDADNSSDMLWFSDIHDGCVFE